MSIKYNVSKVLGDGSVAHFEGEVHTPEEALDDVAVLTGQGEVVVTRDDTGRIVAVTRQDDEGRILKVIAEAEPVVTEKVPKEQPKLRVGARIRIVRPENANGMYVKGDVFTVTMVAPDTGGAFFTNKYGSKSYVYRSEFEVIG